jgi:hypothetical protein
MSTYTVTRVGNTGKPLPGSATRKYQADDARTAGALYVAAEGVDGAQYAGGDAGFYTFNPAADGAPVRVRVELVEDTVSARKVWRCTGDSGSMFAKRDVGGFVEVFQRDLDKERAAGTHLFKITL